MSSHGHILTPVSFFEDFLDVQVCQEKDCISLNLNRRPLLLSCGQCETPPDNQPYALPVPERTEQGVLYLPIVPCAQAPGVSFKQLGQLTVFAGRADIDRLENGKVALQRLIWKTCGIYNAACFTAVDFKSARDAWLRDLCRDALINDPVNLLMIFLFC